MYSQLVSDLGLNSAGTVSEVTQPVSMAGANAVQMDTTVASLTATNVSFQLQQGNDLQNWANVDSPVAATAAGYKLFTANTGVTGAYVRIKLTLTGAGIGVLAAGLNTSQQ